MSMFKLKGLDPHKYDYRVGLASLFPLCLVYKRQSEYLNVINVSAWWFPTDQTVRYQDEAFTRMLL